MAQIPISQREIDLMRKEIETLGELLSQEQLDRKAEADGLKLEIAALKKTIEQLNPEAGRIYDQQREKVIQNFDPETEREAS